MTGVGSARRILCVFPHYTPSFGTFEYSYPLTDGARAFMPPQGLLVIAAYLPPDWEVRFVDENMRRATDADFAWADAVFVSGMHIQRRQMNDICRRAHAFDRPVALGGPSVSACPDYYPSFDYLHIGELGDATDQLVDRLSHDITRPDSQVVFKTSERVEMSDFPVPAYELAEIPRYFIGSVQYSSGCPYQCDFCDIPALYGRNPRLKTPEQVIAELDKLVACGIGDAIYFVDDNFIGNRKAALDLLPHLIAWQQRQGYRIRLACEATLNIAKRPEILSLMREAFFVNIFCGIETPNPEALKAISKDHNMMVPIFDAIKTLNGFGMEVVSGIILGLDTDTPETGRHLIDFIEQSKIPLLTINLLQALPKTPLWDRLAREGRLIEDEERDSNVQFRLPYEHVVTSWRNCMKDAYQPDKVYERYQHQVEHTFPNRLKPPGGRGFTFDDIRRGVRMLGRVIWNVGLVGDYKWVFWRFALARLARADLEGLLITALISHHLIVFSREASTGRQNASNYSTRLREAATVAK
jgi:hopanoid C-2 methylase